MPRICRKSPAAYSAVIARWPARCAITAARLTGASNHSSRSIFLISGLNGDRVCRITRLFWIGMAWRANSLCRRPGMNSAIHCSIPIGCGTVYSIIRATIAGRPWVRFMSPKAGWRFQAIRRRFRSVCLPNCFVVRWSHRRRFCNCRSPVTEPSRPAHLSRFYCGPPSVRKCRVLDCKSRWRFGSSHREVW